MTEAADRYLEECHHCGDIVEAFARRCPHCGFRRDTFETVDPTQACIDCGDRGVMRCGCCGYPLCGRHHETGAGFCSRHFTVGGVSLCLHEEIAVGARPREATVLVVHDGDVFHLPDEEGSRAPACRPREDGKVDVSLALARAADRDLCIHCAKAARQRYRAFREELADERSGSLW
jgi:hypothetical protein